MRRPLRTVSLRRNKPSKLCPVAYFVTDLAMEGWPHLLVLDRQHCDPLCCHLWCGERTRRTKLTRAGTPGDCISKSPSRSPAAASASLSWWGRDDSILCALLVHQLSRSRPSGCVISLVSGTGFGAQRGVGRKPNSVASCIAIG